MTTKLLVFACLSWFFLGLNIGLGFTNPIVGLLIIVFVIAALIEGKRTANIYKDTE